MPGSRRYRVARHAMLEQLLERGISSRLVLAAMARISRERFVPSELHDLAYADRAVPIGCDQTISQPYIVALMTQSLQLSGHEHVLEVGTGSGYQTAVLSALAKSVVSIERHAALSHRAARRLEHLGCQNVTLEIGDGTQGWPARAPYDRILVAAAASQIPLALEEQLAEGGILVIPVGDTGGQVLQALRKREGRLECEDLANCRFVPLIGAQANPS